MNWIDIAIIGLICIGVISGARKGFVASITSIACMLISIVVAKTYYKVLSMFLLTNTPLKDVLTNYMTEKKLLQGATNLMPGGAMTTFYSDYFMNDIHTFLSIAIINIISIIAIYFVVRLVLYVVEGYVKSAAKMPVLNEINKLGGGTVGLIKMVLILLMIFAVIVPASNIIPWQGLKDGLQTSLLAKYLYSYNFILGWIWNTAIDLVKK